MRIADFETQIAINGFADVDGTKVSVIGVQGVTENEARAYIEDVRQKFPHEAITELTISPAEDGKVSIDYNVKPPQFQRIRRITGYLVGTLDRFNNAKRKEEHDRVKHDM